jgi:amino acid transporter
MIGFEDMVTLAEEVKSVRRTLPIAIVVSILVTTLLYIMVSLVAVLSLDLKTLSASATPMAELVREQGRGASVALWAVSLMTGINGALVQLMMAARVAYGMARRNQAPSWLGVVHPRARTPVRATLGVGAVTLTLALMFPLTTLAKITSAILLLVFAGVNLALWRIKGLNPDKAGEGPRYPRSIPLAGFAVSVSVLLFQGWYELTA